MMFETDDARRQALSRRDPAADGHFFYAVLTTGRWEEVAAYVAFMGYTEPWYSVRDADAPIGGGFVAHLDGSLFEKTVVMIDSPNMTAELDDPSDVSDEEYDSM